MDFFRHFRFFAQIFAILTFNLVLLEASGANTENCLELVQKLVLHEKAAAVDAATHTKAPPKWRIPSIDKTSTAVSPPKIARANHYLETVTDPVVLAGPPESTALRREAIMLEGGGKHTASLDASGNILHLVPSAPGISAGKIYDGVEYLEFPNSTLLHTIDSTTGKPRSFLLARGVRRYSTDIDLATGAINPQGYVSDVLVFEMVYGKSIYRSRLLKSAPESKFFFEDPRISTLHFPDGSQKTFLSGTDYSPHVAGGTNPDVMNRYVELKINKHGLPEPIPTTAGVPKFENLSPFPKIRADGGGTMAIDAKNATIAFNEQGQVVVRTRLRPDFSVPDIKAMARGESWKYGEQVFTFKDYDEFKRYDWNHSVEDLFHKGPILDARVRPLVAKSVLKDSQIKELYQDARVVLAKGKGMGPGTPPVRVVRRGDQLFVSDGKNALDVAAGKVPANFPLKDGEVTYVTFDHEIRYFKDTRGGDDFLKRHYSLSVKQFDPSLTNIQAYYGDALQPRQLHELGYNSGIGDLQHVYPMGREVITGSDGVARVRVSLGVSDAHTEIVEVNIKDLLMEMAPGSSQWQSGQVYRP